MDPQAATAVAKTATDPTQLTALMTLSFGLMKLLEMTLTALFKKYKPSKPHKIEVEIDPDFKKKIDGMVDKLNQVSSVMERTDNDGTPMVYSSRTSVEAIREIAVIIRNISQTQERLTNMLDRLEQKFVEHDRTDMAVFTAMNASIERVTRTLDEQNERITDGFKETHRRINELKRE